jgi:hypothetical protein
MSNLRENIRKAASGAGLSVTRGRADWLQGERIGALWLLCLFLSCGFSASAAPSVTNVSFGQQPGTRLVSVSYDLAGGTCNVSLLVSNDNGATYNVPVKSVTGAVGNGVTSGRASGSSGMRARTGPGSTPTRSRCVSVRGT